MPGVIFTDPEIASVGLTEDEARGERNRGQNRSVSLQKPWEGPRPWETQGKASQRLFPTLQAASSWGCILWGLTRRISSLKAVLQSRQPSHLDDLTLTMHPHPTLPESIEAAAEQVEHRAIDIFNPPRKGR